VLEINAFLDAQDREEIAADLEPTNITSSLKIVKKYKDRILPCAESKQ